MEIELPLARMLQSILRTTAYQPTVVRNFLRRIRVISFRKPSPESLRRILAVQSGLDFNYPGVGTTAPGGTTPDGFTVDHTRVQIGRGAKVFDRGRAALEKWSQFQLGWVEAFPNDTPLRTGNSVIVLARAFGLWWVNAARIVYTMDESATGSSQTARFGFAYGTLPGHVERGEERFLIEWDQKSDQVWFDILAFSQPRHFLTRIGRRQTRTMQKRFAAQSAAAMTAAARIE